MGRKMSKKITVPITPEFQESEKMDKFVKRRILFIALPALTLALLLLASTPQIVGVG